MKSKKESLVYILAPVREVTPRQSEIIKVFVSHIKNRGDTVFNPIKDAPQEDKTGFNIVMTELIFLEKMSRGRSRVEILWNLGGKASEGSRVDIGMAYALRLRMNLVTIFNMDEPSGPQLAYRTIQETTNKFKINKPHQRAMNKKLREFGENGEAIIDWDVEMLDEDQERQRINLGLALGVMAKNPDFKIRMGELRGIDPEDKKSYPKVIKEIERRQSVGEAL